jgi:hypothetical protein
MNASTSMARKTRTPMPAMNEPIEAMKFQPSKASG